MTRRDLQVRRTVVRWTRPVPVQPVSLGPLRDRPAGHWLRLDPRVGEAAGVATAPRVTAGLRASAARVVVRQHWLSRSVAGEVVVPPRSDDAVWLVGDDRWVCRGEVFVKPAAYGRWHRAVSSGATPQQVEASSLGASAPRATDVDVDDAHVALGPVAARRWYGDVVARTVSPQRRRAVAPPHGDGEPTRRAVDDRGALRHRWRRDHRASRHGEGHEGHEGRAVPSGRPWSAWVTSAAHVAWELEYRRGPRGGPVVHRAALQRRAAWVARAAARREARARATVAATRNLRPAVRQDFAARWLDGVDVGRLPFDVATWLRLQHGVRLHGEASPASSQGSSPGSSQASSASSRRGQRVAPSPQQLAGAVATVHRWWRAVLRYRAACDRVDAVAAAPRVVTRGAARRLVAWLVRRGDGVASWYQAGVGVAGVPAVLVVRRRRRGRRSAGGLQWREDRRPRRSRRRPWVRALWGAASRRRFGLPLRGGFPRSGAVAVDVRRRWAATSSARATLHEASPFRPRWTVSARAALPPVPWLRPRRRLPRPWRVAPAAVGVDEQRVAPPVWPWATHPAAHTTVRSAPPTTVTQRQLVQLWRGGDAGRLGPRALLEGYDDGVVAVAPRQRAAEAFDWGRAPLWQRAVDGRGWASTTQRAGEAVAVPSRRRGVASTLGDAWPVAWWRIAGAVLATPPVASGHREAERAAVAVGRPRRRRRYSGEALVGSLGYAVASETPLGGHRRSLAPTVTYDGDDAVASWSTALVLVGGGGVVWQSAVHDVVQRQRRRQQHRRPPRSRPPRAVWTWRAPGVASPVAAASLGATTQALRRPHRWRRRRAVEYPASRAALWAGRWRRDDVVPSAAPWHGDDRPVVAARFGAEAIEAVDVAAAPALLVVAARVRRPWGRVGGVGAEVCADVRPAGHRRVPSLVGRAGGYAWHAGARWRYAPGSIKGQVTRWPPLPPRPAAVWAAGAVAQRRRDGCGATSIRRGSSGGATCGWCTSRRAATAVAAAATPGRRWRRASARPAASTSTRRGGARRRCCRGGAPSAAR